MEFLLWFDHNSRTERRAVSIVSRHEAERESGRRVTLDEKGKTMILAKKLWDVPLILILCFVSAGFYSGFTVRQGAAENDRARSGGWDREGAAVYLDERMDLWLTNAKKLQTGE